MNLSLVFKLFNFSRLFNCFYTFNLIFELVLRKERSTLEEEGKEVEEEKDTIQNVRNNL